MLQVSCAGLLHWPPARRHPSLIELLLPTTLLFCSCRFPAAYLRERCIISAAFQMPRPLLKLQRLGHQQMQQQQMQQMHQQVHHLALMSRRHYTNSLPTLQT